MNIKVEDVMLLLQTERLLRLYEYASFDEKKQLLENYFIDREKILGGIKHGKDY